VHFVSELVEASVSLAVDASVKQSSVTMHAVWAFAPSEGSTTFMVHYQPY